MPLGEVMTRGSPPRWRGARSGWPEENGPLGITPALAGSTAYCKRSCGLCRDHPRVGGEHAAMTVPGLGIRGSPPRWRGALRFLMYRPRLHGITPALAGSTWVGIRLVLLSRDHPRVGGEHSRNEFQTFYAGGSPPRWRGAPCG